MTAPAHLAVKAALAALLVAAQANSEKKPKRGKDRVDRPVVGPAKEVDQ